MNVLCNEAGLFVAFVVAFAFMIVFALLWRRCLNTKLDHLERFFEKMDKGEGF